MVAFIAFFGGIGPWVADYNETHIFNPRWPPHAVFHDGQVIAFASASGLLALAFLVRRRGDAWTNFLAAWGAASLYWLSLSLAALFPRGAWLDPELRDDPSQYVLTIPGNAFGCIVFGALLAVAGGLGWRAHLGGARAGGAKGAST
ncbi:MAG TPA: DUF6640 family protein [Polyangiaceae bacterium]|nr:DUF6640 family protein [Polyangiaceae bacterium]